PRSAAPSGEAESRRSASAGCTAGSQSAGLKPAGRATAASDRGAPGAGTRICQAQAAPADGDNAAAELTALQGEVRRRHAALKLQQVERWRLGPGKDRAAGVRLTPMMGLVVEQMREDIPE